MRAVNLLRSPEYRDEVERHGIPLAKPSEKPRNMSYTEVEQHAKEIALIVANAIKAGIALWYDPHSRPNEFGIVKRKGGEKVVYTGNIVEFGLRPESTLRFSKLAISRFHEGTSHEIPEAELQANFAFLSALKKELAGTGLDIDLSKTFSQDEIMQLELKQMRVELKHPVRKRLRLTNVPRDTRVHYVPPKRAEGTFFRVNIGKKVVIKKPYFDMRPEPSSSLSDVHSVLWKAEYSKRDYLALVNEVKERIKSLKQAGIPVAPLKAIIYRPPRTAHEAELIKSGKRIPGAMVFSKAKPLTGKEAVNRVDEIADLIAKLYHGGFNLETKASSLGIIGEGKESRVVLIDLYPDKPENKSGTSLIYRSVTLMARELSKELGDDGSENLRASLLGALKKRGIDLG